MKFNRRIKNFLHSKSRLKSGERGIFFMHLGKCGGSSIATALIDSVSGDWSGYVNKPALRKRLRCILPGASFRDFESALSAQVASQILQSFANGRRCVFGHVEFNEAFLKYKPQYSFFTVLRAPEARVLSSYKYGVLGGAIPWDSARTPDDQFEEYLDSPAGRYTCRNFVHYFGGLPFDDDDEYLEACFQRALANIKHFDLIGSLECLGSFAEAVELITGKKVMIGHRNRTGSKPSANEERFASLGSWQPKEALLSDLKYLTSLDQKIFEAAFK